MLIIKHSLMNVLRSGLLVIGLAHVGSVALAQTPAKWPERAVSFSVPFPPGGPVDTTARLTTAPLALLWSVPTPIENKAGAARISRGSCSKVWLELRCSTFHTKAVRLRCKILLAGKCS